MLMSRRKKVRHNEYKQNIIQSGHKTNHTHHLNHIIYTFPNLKSGSDLSDEF